MTELKRDPRPGAGARNPAAAFTPEQIARYSRHVLLPEVGSKGQRKLFAARVLIVGAGGLGSPAATYLAAAGVGHLGLVDGDVVDASNLQRQILHSTGDVGRPKVESARERIQAINPDVEVLTFPARLTAANAMDVLEDWELVLDGSDNFPTRYLVNDACVLAGKPLIHGSLFRYEGQATVFRPGAGPCYRCLFPEPPPAGLVPSCQEAGILGAVAGVIGTIQAVETLKLILGIGKSLVGRLLVFDGLDLTFREVKLDRDPACPACGDQPTIRELADTGETCGLTS